MGDLFDQEAEFVFPDNTLLSVDSLPCGCVILQVDMIENPGMLILSSTAFYLQECPEDSDQQ